MLPFVGYIPIGTVLYPLYVCICMPDFFWRYLIGGAVYTSRSCERKFFFFRGGVLHALTASLAEITD